jgi:alanine-synthesizing transaminase
VVFSTRVPSDRRPNALARALDAARARGPLLDLTVANPTRVSIPYPADLLAPLADQAALVYSPSSFGLLDARRAVADDYARRGVPVEADRIVLTASTSEAYSLLFKLLCTARESSVLTPVPSYPLFDHLARLDAVEQRTYALEYQGAWIVDTAAVDDAWTSETRALLAVSPNNPTGSALNDADAEELSRRCAERGAALILDEVFCDYPHSPAAVRTDPFGASLASPCLLFRLGGLSKSAGLPQLKLSWIAVFGPEDLVREAIDRLELICDTYLSVSTPVQLAARSLLARSKPVQAAILARVRRNLEALDRAVCETKGVTRLAADGGWSAVLRIPATDSEEAFALRLLERDGVVVHPGYFFDFPHEAFLVLSLLPEPGVFDRGIAVLLERVHGG